MFHFKLLHQQSTADAVGVARILVFGFWFYRIASIRLESLAELPIGFFDTYGLMRLLGDPSVYLQYPVLLGLRLLVLTLLAAAILGLRPYLPIALTVGILITLFDGVLKGFNTFVNHAQMGMLYSAYILAFMPAADGLSVMKDRNERPNKPEYALTLIFIPLVLCCAYSFVAARRLASGGAGVFLDDSVVSWFATRSLSVSSYGFDLGLLFNQHPALVLLLKVSFAVITVFELLSPFCLIHRAFRLTWLAVIVPFHFLSLLTMNIFFWENLILILAFLTNFPHLVNRQPATKGLPILFYDGTCGLCHGFVSWMVKRDPRGIFRFAPLRGRTAESALGCQEGEPENWSVVLRDEDGT